MPSSSPGRLRSLVFLYLPGLCIALASFTASRYFQFPIQQMGPGLVGEDLRLDRNPPAACQTSISIAACVTVIAVVLGFFGALAFARYDWQGRSCISSSSCCRSSFRNRCWAWRCCCGSTRWAFSCAGRRRSSPIWSGSFRSSRWSSPSRSTASIRRSRKRLSISAPRRWQVLREVTLPVLFPGIFSGALFAFLLSWGNFPLSLVHDRRRHDRAGVSLCQDGCRLHAGRAGAGHRLDHWRSVPADRRLWLILL